MKTKEKQIFKKCFALMIAGIMLISMIPFTTLQYIYAAEPGIHLNQSGTDGTPKLSNDMLIRQGQVITNKYVTEVSPGIFDITLEAVGRAFDEIKQYQINYDVVFVLDYSGSMGSGNDSKLQRMQNAALVASNDLLVINGVNTNHRVAVVGYAETSSILSGTKTVSNPWLSGKQTSSTMFGVTNTSTLPTWTNRGSYTNIIAGMNYAQQILDYRSFPERNRPAVIILMTDGQPNRFYANKNQAGATSWTAATSGTNAQSSGTNHAATDATLIYNDYTKTGLENLVFTDVTGSSVACTRTVYSTIMNMHSIKNEWKGSVTGTSIPRLQLFSIGYDLDNVATANTSAGDQNSGDANVQTALALVTMNPTLENLNQPALSKIILASGKRIVTETVQKILTNLRNQFINRNITAPVIGIPENPVDFFMEATADASSIASAFRSIIDLIETYDPIVGPLTMVDYVDPNFSIISGTMTFSGDLMKNSVNIANDGKLVWTSYDLATVSQGKSTDAVAIGDVRSTLTFRVQFKDTSITYDNIEKIFYTNTLNWNDGVNYAVFDVIQNNPYYFSNTVAQNGASSSGTVTQNLTATGFVSLTYNTYTFQFKKQLTDGVKLTDIDYEKIKFTLTDQDSVSKTSGISDAVSGFVTFENLLPGIYQLNEVSVPDTLIQDTKTYKVIIAENGAITVDGNAYTEDFVLTNKINAQKKQITLLKVFSGNVDHFTQYTTAAALYPAINVNGPNIINVDESNKIAIIGHQCDVDALMLCVHGEEAYEYNFVFNLIHKESGKIIDTRILTLQGCEVAYLMAIGKSPIIAPFELTTDMIGQTFYIEEIFSHDNWTATYSKTPEFEYTALSSINGYEIVRTLVNMYNDHYPVIQFSKKVLLNDVETSLLDGTLTFNIKGQLEMNGQTEMINEDVTMTVNAGVGTFTKILNKYENANGYLVVSEVYHDLPTSMNRDGLYYNLEYDINGDTDGRRYEFINGKLVNAPNGQFINVLEFIPPDVELFITKKVIDKNGDESDVAKFIINNGSSSQNVQYVITVSAVGDPDQKWSVHVRIDDDLNPDLPDNGWIYLDYLSNKKTISYWLPLGEGSYDNTVTIIETKPDDNNIHGVGKKDNAFVKIIKEKPQDVVPTPSASPTPSPPDTSYIPDDEDDPPNQYMPPTPTSPSTEPTDTEEILDEVVPDEDFEDLEQTEDYKEWEQLHEPPPFPISNTDNTPSLSELSAPDVPLSEGHYLVPNDDGSWTEFDDDGVPLGTWIYNPEIEEWEFFDEIVPLGAMAPQTSDVRTTTANIFILFIGISCMFLAINYKKLIQFIKTV